MNDKELRLEIAEKLLWTYTHNKEYRLNHCVGGAYYIGMCIRIFDVQMMLIINGHTISDRTIDEFLKNMTEFAMSIDVDTCGYWFSKVDKNKLKNREEFLKKYIKYLKDEQRKET